MMCRSGRDGVGYHLYIETPPGMHDGNGTHSGHEKIDVRGAGGAAVAPGSRHVTGRYYHWIEGHSLSEFSRPALFPDRFTQKILVKPPPPPRGPQDHPAKDGGVRSDCKPHTSEVDYTLHIKRLREQNSLDLDRIVIRRTCMPQDLKDWKINDTFLDPSRQNYERNLATWEHLRGPGTKYALPDESPSGYEMALAHVMACNKWTLQEAADGIMRWREMHFPGADLPGMSRMRLTLIKAFLSAEELGLIRKKRGPSKGAKYRPRSSRSGSESIHRIHGGAGLLGFTSFGGSVALGNLSSGDASVVTGVLVPVSGEPGGESAPHRTLSCPVVNPGLEAERSLSSPSLGGLAILRSDEDSGRADPVARPMPRRATAKPGRMPRRTPWDSWGFVPRFRYWQSCLQEAQGHDPGRDQVHDAGGSPSVLSCLFPSLPTGKCEGMAPADSDSELPILVSAPRSYFAAQRVRQLQADRPDCQAA